MKNYSEAEKKTLADSFFKKYPTEKEVYITNDGNCFFIKDKGHASNHARTIGQTNLDVYSKEGNVNGATAAEQKAKENANELNKVKGENESLKKQIEGHVQTITSLTNAKATPEKDLADATKALDEAGVKIKALEDAAAKKK
jgi:hypothetical protein